MKRRLVKGMCGAAVGLGLLVGAGCSGDLKTFAVYQLAGVAGAVFDSLTGSVVSAITGQLIPSVINGTTTAATTVDNTTTGGV